MPDDVGNSSQALYFQKMTTTTTNAAGVAVINGVQGMPASALSGLSWDHRTDGHCGAGAPRWDIFLKDPIAGSTQTVFLGCYSDAMHTPLTATDPGGHSWCHDQFSPQPAFTALGVSNFTIQGLEIVFDEGTDNPIAQPPSCPQGPSTPGFIYLDNISITVNGITQTWTAAADNGNGDPPTQAAPAGPMDMPAATPPSADVASQLVGELSLVYPSLSADAYSFYEAVLV